MIDAVREFLTDLYTVHPQFSWDWDNPDFDRLKHFVSDAHFHQENYMEDHIERVVEIAFEYYFDDDIQDYFTVEEVMTVAYLHDICEDTLMPVEEIQRIFGMPVAYAVDNLTDDPGATRKIRKARMKEKMLKSGLARYVKKCDRLQNMMRSFRNGNVDKMTMYRDEFPDFLTDVGHTAENEATDHLVHDMKQAYAAICDKIHELKPTTQIVRTVNVSSTMGSVGYPVWSGNVQGPVKSGEKIEIHKDGVPFYVHHCERDVLAGETLTYTLDYGQ